MKRLPAILACALILAGCSALPSKPVQQVMYDFGPVAPAAPAQASAPREALVLPNVEVDGALEKTELLYRLAYDDPHALRPYAFARWSGRPGDLVGQRLRTLLGRDRPVLDRSAAASLSHRGGNGGPPVLRVALEEFSQVFDSPAASRGVVRLRCTLLRETSGGERLVAQRSFEVARPAPTADAPGGVRALAAATDAAAQEIAAWLQPY
jgi:cholesterol transport system auxiliary component